MTTDIHIPAEALEAGARAAHNQWREECADEACEPVENWREWDDLDEWEQDSFRAQARACFQAMVKAWPGVSAKQRNEHVALFNSNPVLILPLTEAPDDDALAHHEQLVNKGQRS